MMDEKNMADVPAAELAVPADASQIILPGKLPANLRRNEAMLSGMASCAERFALLEGILPREPASHVFLMMNVKGRSLRLRPSAEDTSIVVQKQDMGTKSPPLLAAVGIHGTPLDVGDF